MAEDERKYDLPQDPSTSTAALSQKVQHLLETRPENDKDTIEALRELSTFYGENTAEARRNLRAKVEARNQAINEEFMAAFREVKTVMDHMQRDIAGMTDCVATMTDRLQNTKSKTLQLMEQASKLQNDREKVTMQQDVAAAFIRTFQLTEDEVAILHGSSRDAPITEEFFIVLNRAQEVHSNCRILMQSGHQTLALDVMQRMTLLQETALERLYRWTQAHCRHIENDQLLPLLTRAMQKLQDRPVLFRYILDEYCTARRSILVSAFIDALTLGHRDSLPIELHAHEPKRYIADILAWLHDAVPTEKQLLLVLLQECDRTALADQIAQAIGNITEGLCHPLRSRIEHIVALDAPSTVLYSVATLIRYYRTTLRPYLHESVLDSTFGDLLDASEKSFVSRLQRETRVALGEKAETPGTDLVPAVSVTRLLALLNEVLSVASVAEDRERDILQIVSCIIDPLLQEVNETASRLPTVDMAVYLLNCMHQIHSTLALYEYMDQRLERLQAQSDAQIDTLTSEQASSLVAHLNLGLIYNILQGHDQGPLSSIPGMDPLSIKEFTSKLEAFIVMPDVLLLPQISLLQSSAHRTAAQRRSFEVIGAIYSQLYYACYDPRNLYSNPDGLFSHTPEELLKILNFH